MTNLGERGAEQSPPYLALLNPEQRAAVLHGENPLLILAGAGSGKTRVITTKIAYLIREQGMDPRSILAVTFTNRAAREMGERARQIEPRAAGAMLRTFHSFGAWFLRRNGEYAGLPSNFIIYDDGDALALLSGLTDKLPRASLKGMARNIARAKDYFLNPGDPELDRIDYHQEFRDLYERYEDRMRQTGNVDFGDLIKKPVEILRSQPELAQKFHNRFRVVLVDEYQDANTAQFALLKELCGGETYVCVVGDDDQSIYRFRGAEVRNILEFPERFPHTTIIRLERNYRSTAPILALASSVVGHNQDRLGKTLRSERGPGKAPVLAFLPDQDAELAFCAELIERSAAYADWAILYRTNAQSLGFETELLRRRIPYRVVGSLKFYEREEIKDALGLLSFLVNPRDEVAFRRVINKPSRGLGAVTVNRIVEAAGGFRGDLAQAAAELAPALAPKARRGLAAFLDLTALGNALLDGGRAPPGESPDGAAAAGAPPADAPALTPRRNGLQAAEGLSVCAAALIQKSGLAELHGEGDEIEGTQRIANLQELINAASLYPADRQGLLQFLEHIELDRAIETGEDGGDAVTLITLHNTKGLEFKRVIITGNEQGVFPRHDKKDQELEEERRLFYVGVTRAMDELYLTSCAMRRMYGRTALTEPSLFLFEADRRYLRVLGEAPPGFVGGGSDRPPAVGNPALSHGAAPKQAPAHPRQALKVSSDKRWRVGDRVFHDDHGYGQVTGIQEDPEDGPLIRVRFETSRELRFLSRYQSGGYIKLGED